MGQSVHERKLVFNMGRWFVEKEGGGRIPLPDEKEPLVISYRRGLIKRHDQPDRRPEAARRDGLVILCRFKIHGNYRRITWWAVCPPSLIGRRLYLLAGSKTSRPRLHSRLPHALRRAS